MYKGFEIKRAPYKPSPYCAEISATAIFHDGVLQSFVSGDEGFPEHVIDVKLKEGAWPKKPITTPDKANGKPAADCGSSRKSAAKCRKVRHDATERSAI